MIKLIWSRKWKCTVCFIELIKDPPESAEAIRNEWSAPVGRKSGCFNCINYSPPIICEKSFMSGWLESLSMHVKISWVSYDFSENTKLAVLLVQIRDGGACRSLELAATVCLLPYWNSKETTSVVGNWSLLKWSLKKRKTRQSPEGDDVQIYPIFNLLIHYYAAEDNTQRMIMQGITFCYSSTKVRNFFVTD